jgi:hypothetical protein
MELRLKKDKIMNNDSDFDLAMQKIWTNGALVSEKRKSDDSLKHGSTGNTNASKEVTKSSVLTMRCTPSEKAKWVNAAKGQKLAEWVTEALNNEAEKRPQ